MPTIILPMKILVPIIGFGAAGGYRVLSELANHWKDAGHIVDFLVDARSPEPYFPTRAGIIRFDTTGRILPAGSELSEVCFAGSGNAYSIYYGMWRALQRIGHNYDVILANHSLTTFPVSLARTGATRKFYYVQAYEPEYYALAKGIKSRILQLLSRASYTLPLVQIANAPIYIDHPAIHAAQWIPPGVDPSVFYRRSSPPVFLPNEPWTIGVIGRHEPAKGTRYALEAFVELARTDPYVRLKVAFGNLPDGWCHERAEVVVPRNDSELADYYRSVDVLLAPGTVQLGAVHYPVLESMACGTPVITTGYLPANRENTWIVPIHDSKSIVEAAHDIYRMPNEQLKSKLDDANSAISAFFWPVVAQEFLDAFNSTNKPCH